jgi:tripartite-type tricarboxylate transporter receptor subunit TctC
MPLNEIRRVTAIATLALLSGVAAGGVAVAQSPAEFYKGKNVVINVGYGAGGGYDTTARLVARHLGKHIPGNPNIVVQNMPGGGSMVAINHLYNVAPKDGTALAVFGANMMLEPLFGNKNAQYSSEKLSWIGNMHADIHGCAVWKGAGQGIKTFDDLLKAKQPVIFGGEAPESETSRFPSFMRNVFNAPIRIVTGYKGTRDINLAMQNGEVQASCGMFESSVRTAFARDLETGDLRIVFHSGLDRKSELYKEATAVGDLLKTDEMRRVGELIFRPTEITRPLAAPPGVPADRVAALRTALMATMKDPELVADAKKMSLDFAPMTGERVQTLMVEFNKASPELVKKALELVAVPR